MLYYRRINACSGPHTQSCVVRVLALRDALVGEERAVGALASSWGVEAFVGLMSETDGMAPAVGASADTDYQNRNMHQALSDIGGDSEAFERELRGRDKGFDLVETKHGQCDVPISRRRTFFPFPKKKISSFYPLFNRVG